MRRIKRVRRRSPLDKMFWVAFLVVVVLFVKYVVPKLSVDTSATAPILKSEP